MRENLSRLRNHYPKGAHVYILNERHLGGSIVKSSFISKMGVELIKIVGEKRPLVASDVVLMREGD